MQQLVIVVHQTWCSDVGTRWLLNTCRPTANPSPAFLVVATCDRLTVVISTSHVWNSLRTEGVHLHTPALQTGTHFLLTLETIVFLFHLLGATSKPFSSLSTRLAHAVRLGFFYKNALYKFTVIIIIIIIIMSTDTGSGGRGCVWSNNVWCDSLHDAMTPPPRVNISPFLPMYIYQWHTHRLHTMAVRDLLHSARTFTHLCIHTDDIKRTLVCAAADAVAVVTMTQFKGRRPRVRSGRHWALCVRRRHSPSPTVHRRALPPHLALLTQGKSSAVKRPSNRSCLIGVGQRSKVTRSAAHSLTRPSFTWSWLGITVASVCCDCVQCSRSLLYPRPKGRGH